MDIRGVAVKIAENYTDHKADMNEAISKFASENILNFDQTQRLIEECNKAAYLSLFEKTGEQIFDVASLDKVRMFYKDVPKMTKDISEKTASYTKDSLNAYGVEFKYESKTEMTKIASYNDQELDESFKKALVHCDENLGTHLTKISEIRKIAIRNKPILEKVADFKELAFELSNQKTETFDKLASDLTFNINEYEKFSKIKNILLEKKAGILSSILSSGVEAAGSLGGKLVSTVVKNPIKSFDAAAIAGTGISAFKKPLQGNQKLIGNIMIPKTAEKTAAEISPSVLSFITSHILPAAGIGLGIAGINYGISGIGGMIAKHNAQKNLNDSFEQLLAQNPDLQRDPVQSRAYFDVIARHAPSLAMDPMVAPQLISQFDSFGGVDVQTVKNLREIESEGTRRGPVPDYISNALSTTTNLSGIGKSLDEHSGHRNLLSKLNKKELQDLKLR